MASKEAVVAKKQQKPATNKKKGAFKQFLKEFWGEVKKLSWPTAKETLSNSLTVVAVIALFAVLIGVLDALLGLGINALMGIG